MTKKTPLPNVYKISIRYYLVILIKLLFIHTHTYEYDWEKLISLENNGILGKKERRMIYGPPPFILYSLVT